MSTTTNYSLELPQKGQKDWNTHLNGNFTKIDTEIHKNASNIGDIAQLSEGDLVEAIKNDRASLAQSVKDLFDFTGFLQRDGKSVVITGESTAYNKYDYDTETRTNAYDCFPGMLSWSFMVRDAIHRNDPFFKSIEELQCYSDENSIPLINNRTTVYELPFNNIVGQLKAVTQTASIYVYYRHLSENNKAILYMSKNPNNTACSFDIYVDGVFVQTVDNNGIGGLWQGYAPLEIELNCTSGGFHEIKFTNFVGTATTPHATDRVIYLHGIGSKHTNVNLTGRGGWTVADLLGDINNRIKNYYPDLVICMIGANDMVARTPIDTYKANIQSIIDSVRISRRYTKFLFIATTNMQHPTVPEYDQEGYVPLSVVRQYTNAMRDVATANGCHFIDTQKLFENIDIADWRYDKVHMKKYGNKILADTVMKVLMNDGVYDKTLVNPVLSYTNFIRHKQDTIHGSTYLTWNTTNGNFDVSPSPTRTLGHVLSAERPTTATIRVKFRGGVQVLLGTDANYLVNFIPVNLVQFGSPTKYYKLSVQTATRNYVDFAVRNLDGTIPPNTEWGSDFKFVLTF